MNISKKKNGLNNENNTMRTIIEFINEAHNFIIKGHTKKQILPYVDMGFPSGTKWAKCNLGADKSEDGGLLFQFARLDGYKYKDPNHKFMKDKDYKSSSGKKYKEGSLISIKDDAALNSNGSTVFRLPTVTQCQELIDFTKRSIEKINDKKCLVLTSIKNDAQLILPLTGYWDEYFDLENYIGAFWTKNHWAPKGAASLIFDDEKTIKIETCYDFQAINIRPVVSE